MRSDLLFLQPRPEENQEAGEQAEVHLQVLWASCEQEEEPLPADSSKVEASQGSDDRTRLNCHRE